MFFDRLMLDWRWGAIPIRHLTKLLLVFFLILMISHFALRTSRAQAILPGAAQQVDVSEFLERQLATATGPVSFLIILRTQGDSSAILEKSGVTAASRDLKAATLYTELTTLAAQSQAPLRAWLDAQGIAYRPFYLINMIEVRGNAALVQTLRQRSDIGRLIANPLVANPMVANPMLGQGLHEAMSQLPWFKTVAVARPAFSAARPYGLDFTHAPEVWAMGYTGQGIVLASQDTGVEWDHPALKTAYRGVVTTTVSHVYNWFDAWGIAGRPARCLADPQVPCDDGGHGTHTVGTMLGDATVMSDTVLGMAPDAKWIGCRNMRNGFGTPASYTACFEFFLAPYPQGGDPFQDGRPELAPHIINNSWGCPPSEGCDAESLRQVVETVRAAGQFVVASAGNNGSSCATVRDPIAIYDATFSVGAHDSTGKIAGFSSRGPVTVDGGRRPKPDISAPGVAVRSAWISGGFNTIQGTSMASPHVAGAAALLWSAVPALIGNIDLTEQILIKSANPVPQNQCEESATPVVPNLTYGFGELNILAAVQLAQQPASLTVRVIDRSGNPVGGAVVRVTDKLTGYQYHVETLFNGIARLNPLYAGSYRVDVAGSKSIDVDMQGNENAQIELQAGWSYFFPLMMGAN